MAKVAVVLSMVGLIGCGNQAGVDRVLGKPPIPEPVVCPSNDPEIRQLQEQLSAANAQALALIEQNLALTALIDGLTADNLQKTNLLNSLNGGLGTCSALLNQCQEDLASFSCPVTPPTPPEEDCDCTKSGDHGQGDNEHSNGNSKKACNGTQQT